MTEFENKLDTQQENLDSDRLEQDFFEIGRFDRVLYWIYANFENKRTFQTLLVSRTVKRITYSETVMNFLLVLILKF